MGPVRKLLSKILRAERDLPARVADIGADRRVYAVGDVHGRCDLLIEMLDMIEADCRARGAVGSIQIILLGDLIDRGPDSAGVIDLMLELLPLRPHVLCLKGNHEEVFELALDGDMQALGFFLRAMGGRETLLSYGMTPETLDGPVDAVLHAAVLEHVPSAHREFLRNLPDSYAVGDYLFVHAGIRPGVPLPEQVDSDLRWIREEFLGSRADHGRMIVHGHTITQDIDERPNRIGIDTGAFASGHLTAIGLEGTDRWFLST